VPAVRKRKSRLHLTLTNSDQATAHGGQVLVDGLCRGFDLWRKLEAIASVDPRRRKTSGFAPSAAVGQLLLTLTSGGVSLADAERLGQDRALTTTKGTWRCPGRYCGKGPLCWTSSWTAPGT
jgi:hypothetical protein